MRPQFRHAILGVLGALLAVAVLACGDDASPASPNAVRAVVPWAPFTLRPGEVVRIDRTDLLLGLTGVTADSRCPVDALIQCVSAGSARVRLWVGPQVADALPFDLESGEEPRSRDLGPLRLHLREVAPPARLGGIPAGEYVVELLLTRDP